MNKHGNVPLGNKDALRFHSLYVTRSTFQPLIMRTPFTVTVDKAAPICTE